MLKWILGVVLALVLILVIGVFILLRSINGIAAAAVEKAGTYAAGVETTVGGVEIGLTSGEMKLAGLKMANPEGFEAPHFLQLGSTEVAISLPSLRHDVIEVPKIHLDGLELNAEYVNGKMNFQKIMDHINAVTAGTSTEPAPEAEPAKDGKQFIIREILITNTKLHGTMTLFKGAPTQQINTVIPEMRLENVGSGDNGATLEEVMQKILHRVIKSAIQSVTKDTGSAIGSEGKSLTDDLGSKLGGLLRGDSDDGGDEADRKKKRKKKKAQE